MDIIKGTVIISGMKRHNAFYKYARRSQAGFTLIELIMVMVILGILSAIAIPKYIDLQFEARAATANGVLGAAASSCAINYAAGQTKQNPPEPITNCTLLANSMDSSGVTISSGDASQECIFNVDGSDFIFSLTPETESGPCGVIKDVSKWPLP